MATPDKPLFPEESTGDWTVDMYRSLLNGKNPRKSFAILAMVHDLGPLTKAEVQEVHDKLKLLRDRARAKYPDWATREQTFQPNVLPEDEPLLSDSDFTDDESSMDESSDESALSRSSNDHDSAKSNHTKSTEPTEEGSGEVEEE